MGRSDSLHAYTRSLAEYDLAQSKKNGLMYSKDSRMAPIHGFAICHGQAKPFTLDITRPEPAPERMMAEQLALAVLLLAAFIAPVVYLLN